MLCSSASHLLVPLHSDMSMGARKLQVLMTSNSSTLLVFHATKSRTSSGCVGQFCPSAALPAVIVTP